jgi:hypothetical protein
LRQIDIRPASQWIYVEDAAAGSERVERHLLAGGTRQIQPRELSSDTKLSVETTWRWALAHFV